MSAEHPPWPEAVRDEDELEELLSRPSARRRRVRPDAHRTTSSSSARAARWAPRSPVGCGGPSTRPASARRVLAVARFSEAGPRGGPRARRDRDDRLRPARPRAGGRPAQASRTSSSWPAGSSAPRTGPTSPGPRTWSCPRSWPGTSPRAGSSSSRAATCTRSSVREVRARPSWTRSRPWESTPRPASAASGSSSTPRASGARGASSSGCSTRSTCATARSWTWPGRSTRASRWPCTPGTSTRSGRATRAPTPSARCRCARAPPRPLVVTGPEVVSVREVAQGVRGALRSPLAVHGRARARSPRRPLPLRLAPRPARGAARAAPRLGGGVGRAGRAEPRQAHPLRGDRWPLLSASAAGSSSRGMSSPPTRSRSPRSAGWTSAGRSPSRATTPTPAPAGSRWASTRPSSRSGPRGSSSRCCASRRRRRSRPSAGAAARS